MAFKNLATDEIPLYVVEEEIKTLSCQGCRDGKELDFDFTMAFQPLVDLAGKKVFGYEALVRGLNNESAYSVIQKVNAKNLYKFDQVCRVKAIALASALNLTERLNINFLPGAVYKPDLCIRTTLAAADRYGLSKEQLTFEVVESDHIADTNHLQSIFDYYKEVGFKVAIDDFGSGFANLDWLAMLEPDSVKIDMSLIRDIDSVPRKRSITSSLAKLCFELNIEILAEGIETKAERDVLAELGVVKQQGYYFSKPGFEQLPHVDTEKFD